MNYFLLANNRNFDWSILKDKLTMDDMLVLFNFLIPLNNEYIHQHTNKICVSRKRPIKHRQNSIIDLNVKEFYCNMSNIKKHENLFEKIYFLPCPDNIEQNPQSYTENINYFNYNIEKIKCMPYDPHVLRKRLNYHGVGIRYEVSTGIIVYNFFKQMYPSNKVILVGFTSDLSEFHESKWEREYFLNEISNDRCYSIGSYGITNFI